MAKSQRKQKKPNKLRQLAEKRFNTKSAALANISVDNLDEALHELAVHQIELEMQNKELIRTQEELSNSRNNYLSLYDFAPIGYFTLDTRGQILEANLTGARFLGVERRSLLNKKFTNFIAKEDQDIFYFYTKDVFENEELQSCELKVTRKDGVLFNAQLVSVAVNFQVNESAQHLLSIIDITERKRVEKKLRESEERFRGIFEQAAVGIAQNSPDGKFLRVNDRFCQILGYTHDEFLNLTVPDITHSDDLEVERHEIRRLVALETDIHQMEKRFIHKDGREIWGRATVSLVRERSGQPKYFIGVLEDITKQKEAEKAVKEKDKSLEHQAQHLLEVNTALKVLIEHREEEKEELIDNLIMNLKKLVFPYLEKLNSCNKDGERSAYVKIIESNLEDIISPFTKKLSSKLLSFTSSEIQIADLVKHGKTSKEIASMLNISPKAVAFHRHNIRKKLDISNKKINLTTYLQTLP